MKTPVFLIATLILPGGLLNSRAAAPVVANVVATQRSGTKLVDIHYY